MNRLRSATLLFLTSLATVAPSAPLLRAGEAVQQQSEKAKRPPPAQVPRAQSAKQPTPDEELEQTIQSAGNDRAALVRNLEAYLKRFPDSPRRPEIYRALVEAEVQLRDIPRASDYAERVVALSPDDMSMTLLAIQLLEQAGDTGGLRRATSYATRVLDYVQRDSPATRSPHASQQTWEQEQRRTRMTVLLVRGRIFSKLRDNASAVRDFQESYALVPNATAAQKLGETAELQKDLPGAIKQYARAFALAEASSSREDVRRKLGNVWRLTHGTEEGLGEYILRTYDEITFARASDSPKRNSGTRDVYDFTLRRAPEGLPVALSHSRAKVVVLNFWATWCGPCRALEPQIERVAEDFRQTAHVLFLAVNCDEDETLVPPYLTEEKLKTTVVYADGLDQLLGVRSFPTVIVLDRSGKIAYRSEGFGVDDFEKVLSEAVHAALAAPSPSS